MSFPWVLCVLFFGFTPIAASAAIRTQFAQFALHLPIAEPFIHVLLTADLAVEKVSFHV